jgi:uncharacterized protein (DUF1330 family)
MTVYVIADINVTDDGWIPGYAASVHELVHKHGGKYLSRSRNVKTLEGKPLDTTFIALLEFHRPKQSRRSPVKSVVLPADSSRLPHSNSANRLECQTGLCGNFPQPS